MENKKEEFIQIFNEISDQYISEANPEKWKKPEKREGRSAVYQSIILAAAALLICILGGAMLYGNNGTDNKVSQNLSEWTKDMQVIHPLNAAGEVSFDQLIGLSDLIVIGEFCRDTEQLVFDGNEEHLVSTNSIKVKKILKGELPEDEIRIRQRYGVIEQSGEKVLYSVSGLTPMVKGERWIFFLTYNEQTEDYTYVGDCGGRYPLPNQQILEICEKKASVDGELFGVYDPSEINLEVYREILGNFVYDAYVQTDDGRGWAYSENMEGVWSDASFQYFSVQYYCMDTRSGTIEPTTMMMQASANAAGEGAYAEYYCFPPNDVYLVEKNNVIQK